MKNKDYTDNKVIQLSVEPDISDAVVMESIRAGITYAKRVKCKTVFLLLIPEDDNESAFIKVGTRSCFQEKIILLDYINMALTALSNYISDLIKNK